MMRQCPKCGGEMADAHDTCGVCGAPIDGVEPVDCPPELPIMATLVESPLRPKPPQVPVGMPRRFSIGTMMILTTLFAVLFGILKACHAPPNVFVSISVFIGGIAACQAVLFKGKQPRLASAVGGILMFFLIGAVMVVLEYRATTGPFHDIIYLVGSIVGVTMAAMFFGGPLGYAVGCVAAAVFLVRKEPDDSEPTPEEQPLMQGNGGDLSMLERQPRSRLPRELSLTKLDGAWQEAGNLGEGLMQRCWRCGAVAADFNGICGICGTVFDGVESAGGTPGLPGKAKVWGAPFGLKPSQPAVSVPRRFSVGTMMILVTAFAMLLGILKTVGVPPLEFAAISLFIAGVGVCQVLLFKGMDPRKASFFGGMISFAVVAVLVALVAVFQAPSVEIAIEVVFYGCLFAPIFGGPLGYAAGCLVAAIFLVRKEPDDAEPAPEDSPEHRP